MSRDDADLTDEALRDEIELVASLVVAATDCHGRMDRAELDSLLGVKACPSHASAVSPQSSVAARSR